MSKPIDRLNELANSRFEELKKKLKFPIDLAKSGQLPKADNQKIDTKKLEKLMSEPVPTMNREKVQEVDDSIFSKIDALGLSPNLSLAVSFILISEVKPETKIENLQKAISVLESEL